MTYRPTGRRLLAMALIPALALLLAVAGCGGDDDPAKTETTVAAEPVDAAAFQTCMLSPALNRSIYEEVKQPDQAILQVAEDGDAEFFEASKADEGIAYFYMPADPATAEELSASASTALAELADSLAAQAPKGITIGETPVETEEGVVFGLIPFAAGGEAELIEEIRADVTDCLGEI